MVAERQTTAGELLEPREAFSHGDHPNQAYLFECSRSSGNVNLTHQPHQLAMKGWLSELKMLVLYILASALAAGSIQSVKAAPNPISSDGQLIKRCGFLAECSINSKSTTNTNDNTHTIDGTQTNTDTRYKNSGNQVMSGNNRGGMNNSAGITVQGLCRRQLMELREAEADHLVKRSHPHHGHPPAGHNRVPLGSAPGGAVDPNALRNSILMNVQSQFSQKTRTQITGSDNTVMQKNIQRQQNTSIKNQSGTAAGNGMMCKRAMDEFEVEKREMDRGGSVLAAIGGALPDSATVEPVHILAIRDLGRLAESLGVRAAGHEQTASIFKRDVGIECEAGSCDELARREAHDILVNHAQSLAFS